MHDEILDIIETKDRKALCITPDKVIIAELGNAGGGPSLVAVFGLLGEVVDSERRGSKKEQIGKLSPEGILTADEKNFAIPYTEIIRVEMSKGFLGSKVKLIVGVREHKFKLKNTDEYYKCKFALKPVLGDKLVVV